MENKNRKIDILLPLIIALVLVVGIYFGSRIGAHYSNNTGSRNMLFQIPGNKTDQVLELILTSYVDSVSSNKLEETAIVAMLKTLDPHSVFIPAADLASVNEPIEGNFSGIGIQFNMLSDTIVVINTTPKGPSEKVGLMAGDRIIRVNDSLVAGVRMPSNDIVKLLKGKTGTKVKVSILRKGENKLLDFNITRDKIPLISIDASYMISTDVAYVKVNKFSRTTTSEFTNVLKKLKSEGMTKLILDLRENPGGIIDGAISMTELFLPEGKLIVYTEGRERPRQDYFSKGKNGQFTDIKLVLLIDERSASSSEIVAGAIQDNDRGTIIGRRSFGKGLVQEQHSLYDGSALRLTVSRYYTPTGRSIQKPYDLGEEDYYNELTERYNHGEMEQADSIHFNDSLKYITPGGKTVYGGGGITPDIFVPVDTSGYTKYYAQVLRRGLIYRFAFDYTDKHRKQLKEDNDGPEALQQHLHQADILRKFTGYAAQNGIKNTYKDLQISGSKIETILVAYIARNIFDENAFYYILNKTDKVIQRGVEEFNNTEN